MNRAGRRVRSGVAMVVASLMLVLMMGCATTRVDWANRIGIYSYDQAIMDYGPPDRTAKLSDGSTVAEWLTHRGYSYAYSPFGYGYHHYPYAYGFYPGYIESVDVPGSWLRLTFDPQNQLKAWKKFYK
ncbi:MAG TPA: hypothetical protein VN673_10520 [Clostridia bacterium]|nr:hypothetical protein [Clostridia bacterium]